jgi:ribosome-associated protein YbcJ (S4-like RNA binding protein)
MGCAEGQVAVNGARLKTQKIVNGDTIVFGSETFQVRLV